MTFSRIELPLADAKEMARALIPHVMSDRWSQINTALGGAVMGGKYGHYAVATDRYTVARYDLANIIDEPTTDEYLWVPLVALRWIATLGPTLLFDPTHDHVVTIDVSMTTFGGERPMCRVILTDTTMGLALIDRAFYIHPRAAENSAKFPPVDRLFGTFEPGPITELREFSQNADKWVSFASKHKTPVPIRYTAGADGKTFMVQVGKRLSGLTAMPNADTLDYALAPAPISQVPDTQTPASTDDGPTRKDAHS